MKFNFYFPVSCFLLIISLSCHSNRLNTDQKVLEKEIILQEKEKKTHLNSDQEKGMPEKSKTSSVQIRFSENRSVDRERPPILIDISADIFNTQILKLSDIGSSVRYVKLQTPPDTSMLYDPFFFRDGLNSLIRSDGEQIIFQGLYGLTRFKMDGEYLETIWKNETGIKYYGSSVMFGGRDFFGIMPTVPVSLIDGNLFYLFLDGPGGNGQIMKYKTGSGGNLSADKQQEIPGKKEIRGHTLFNYKQIPAAGFSNINGINGDSWAGFNNKWNAGKSGSLLVTYSNNGDTLCNFKDYDRILNFHKSNYRMPVNLVCYNFHESVTLKPEYNDTVFRLVSPNRLLPVYIINFGKHKVGFMDGLDPDVDLSDKFLLNSLCESDAFIFIRYSQNYDSQLTRRKKEVKFYNTVFFKKESRLYRQQGFSLLPEGLPNDLDGGLPFWPDFITPQGEMMKLVSGKIIKNFMNSSGFTDKKLPTENRTTLMSLASGLKNTDMVIMIVK